MNQLSLFEQPVPTKRNLTHDETVRVIWASIARHVVSTRAEHHRNWLHHTTAPSQYKADMPAGTMLDSETFVKARRTVLDGLEQRMRQEETIPQKLARYSRESARIRYEKRDEIDAIRQKREAAEVKAKQRRVQTSEAVREGAAV